MEGNSARDELLMRVRSRTSLLEYTRNIEIPGLPAGYDDNNTITAHHQLILSAIEETSSKSTHGRLMIFAPPGSAKTTYASVVFPSWYLGNRYRRVILASYGDLLARKIGRRTRNIIKQDKYKRIWGANLSRESQAANTFLMSNGSEYLASGILSGVTGNRAHGIVIDDPVKGRAQANSAAVRESVWLAYNDDLKTRLMPGGWVVLIQTRWHQDDLAGRILPEEWNGESGMIKCRDGNEWRVICLQARCETDTDPLGRNRGEYLWPEWFGRGHWDQFESLPYTWASLYQQTPAIGIGNMFHPDEITIMDSIPVDAGIDWVRGWDLASVSGGGDWTVGGLLGMMPDGRLIIGDIVRIQGAPDMVEAAIVNTAARDGHGVKIYIPQDPAQSGKFQIHYLSRALMGYNVKSSSASGDKITWAEPLAAQCNSGNVLMVRANWNSELIDEMRYFPSGTHDDQVDALSRAFAEIIQRPDKTRAWRRLI